MEEQFNTSFEFAHNKMDDQMKIIEEQSKKIDDYLKIVENLTQENVNLRETVKLLEMRLDDAEQYNQSNTIEIFGVPQATNEDTYDVVTNICAALDVKIEREDIDVCHRLRPMRGNLDRPAGIIARFVTREIKLKVMEKRKIKRNFSTQNIGFTEPAMPVYVNENLTPNQRKLFAAARAFKKEKGYTYLWVKNGKVLMRKDQGYEIIQINSMDDLRKL